MPRAMKRGRHAFQRLRQPNVRWLYPWDGTVIVNPPPVEPPTPPPTNGSFARPFSAASVFNQKVDQANARYQDHPYQIVLSQGGTLGVGWVNREADSFPQIVSDNSGLDWHVTVPANKWRPSGTFTVKGPATIDFNSGKDFTLEFINTDTGDTWSFYQCAAAAGTRNATATTYGRSNIYTGLGYGTTFAQGNCDNAGPRAGGHCGLAGLITGSDFAKGKIDHALNFSAPSKMHIFGTSASDPNCFFGSAIQTDTGANGNTGIMRYGCRIAIPPPSRGGPAKPSGLSQLGSMWWDAMVEYGAVLCDRSPTIGFSADRNSVSSAQIDPFRGGELQQLWQHVRIIENTKEPVVYSETWRSGSFGAWVPRAYTATNNSVSVYRELNCFVDVNRGLILRGNKEGSTWFSGLADTKRTLGFTPPVRINVRMKLPKAKGLWPSQWLKPQPVGPTSDNGFYGPWPSSGEIDNMESVSDGSIYGTVHGDNPIGTGAGNHWQQPSPNAKAGVDVTQFHVYSVEWRTTGFKWLLDGVQYLSTNAGPNAPKPFEKEFFLILNLAIGGTWPGNPDGTTPTSNDMVVDCIWVESI